MKPKFLSSNFEFIHARFNTGLSLIELMVCALIIGIISATALPLSRNYVKSQKESVLREHLKEIREAIDRYYDKRKGDNPNGNDQEWYPKNLENLVEARVLRSIPLDPMTGKLDWRTISSVDPIIASSTNGVNIFDVRSQSDERAFDGSLYREW
ncbi:MAG: type II secretion system protein [Candidatus Riflebacteria bacterium]|nr:type II secretion system protein [Candidatus Riflebacteria bacterium]